MTRQKNQHGILKLEHTTIQGLRPALEEICQWPEVKSCIPGRIRQTRSRSGPFLTVQTQTTTGLKLAAHGHGTVQEVFIVTSHPEEITKLIEEKWQK